MLAEEQFDLLRRLSALDPAPRFMGGYAEDALFEGAVTRPHGDLDLLCRRSELPRLLEQVAEFGFKEFTSMGDAAPGEPFYLCGEVGELKLEIGIADEEDGRLWVCVERLHFDLGGEEPPAGYRFELPADTFAWPPVSLDRIPIRVASPLALYRLRVSIGREGSFGELSEAQLEKSNRLREGFLAELDPAELAPPAERLP